MHQLLRALSIVAVLLFAACGGGSGDGDESPGDSSSGYLSDERLAELIATEVDGFTASDGRVVPIGGVVTYTSDTPNAAGSNTKVEVTISPCTANRCRALTTSEYASDADMQALRSNLSATHADNPELVWAFDTVELAPGRVGLATHARSFVETPADGGSTRASANIYQAWYHDGSRSITFFVSGSPGGVQSLDDVEARLSTAEAEAAAQAVFAAFEPEFED